jgi:hypothetical protein
VSPKKKRQCPRKRGSVYESGRDLTPRRKGAKERRDEEGVKKSSSLRVSPENLCDFASLREPKKEEAIPTKAWVSLRIRKGSHAKAQRRKGEKERRDEEGVKKSSSLRVSPKNLCVFASLREPKKRRGNALESVGQFTNQEGISGKGAK